MTRFKICGVRSADHALVAAESGASFMGFVFVEGVRRQLAVDEAQAIIEEYRAQRGDAPVPGLVGLFADQPAAYVADVVERCGLDFVQLCGSEDPAYWAGMPVPVLRAVRVKDDARNGRRRSATPSSASRKSQITARRRTSTPIAPNSPAGPATHSTGTSPQPLQRNSK